MPCWPIMGLRVDWQITEDSLRGQLGRRGRTPPRFKIQDVFISGSMAHKIYRLNESIKHTVHVVHIKTV